jgi:hypothetical protein
MDSRDSLDPSAYRQLRMWPAARLGLAAGWTARFEIHDRGGRATLVTHLDVRRNAVA